MDELLFIVVAVLLGLWVGYPIYGSVLEWLGRYVPERWKNTVQVSGDGRADTAKSRIGQRGVVVRRLNRVGDIQIDGERVPARTASVMLEVGEQVVVIDQDMHECIVESVERVEQASVGAGLALLWYRFASCCVQQSLHSSRIQKRHTLAFWVDGRFRV